MADETSSQDRLREYVVRRLRISRRSFEPVEDQERIARLYGRYLAFDWHELLAEAAQPGSMNI
jgi:hypothetical protein